MWFKVLIGYVVVAMFLYLALLACIWRWGQVNVGHPRVHRRAEAQPGVVALPYGADRAPGFAIVRTLWPDILRNAKAPARGQGH